ncbi:MAG: hypothetical protein KAW89_07570 [Armatimonadetes bacterium]|nr:hypothetical protein [Armatimonadota bacterium]
MSDIQAIAEMLNVNKRWLPSQPHLDALVQAVQEGRAYLQPRGHNRPPLLVFEDGGAMVLPSVRLEETYRGATLVAAPDEETSEQTRHRDVCGCVDEFKGLLADHPQLLASEPGRFHKLVDDALYMISRMDRRTSEYQQFLQQLAALAAQTMQTPDLRRADDACEVLHKKIDVAARGAAAAIEEMDELIEQVGQVAGDQEEALGCYKQVSVSVRALYREIKGARNWQEDERKADSEQVDRCQ